MLKCPSCGETIEPGDPVCVNCGHDLEDYFNSFPELGEDPPVVLTTAPMLEGYRVTETLEIITSECAYGMNLIKDFFVGITDAWGGRSGTTQKTLRDARKRCLHELKVEAYSLGANAVIAVNLAYSEFSGKGKSMLFLVASGTAVKVEKI